MAKVVVIGAGFSGLSAAAYLAAAGHEVHVFEKHATAGGRARQWKTAEGYVFDMGPSWYWMPDVFERFFADFGDRVSDYYALELLRPSWEVVFGKDDRMKVPSEPEALSALFESIESGSGARLQRFLAEARVKYETAMDRIVYMPGATWREFADLTLLRRMIPLAVFSSFSRHVRRHFSDRRLVALMEFPVLFLGAMPRETPALYSLMNYAGLVLGTWYPRGGFGAVVDGMVKLGQRHGVSFHFDAPVEKIAVDADRVRSVRVRGHEVPCDGVVASADYHHVESALLPPAYRNYQESYWQRRVFAPSCLIYYLGVSTRVDNLHHHTLFFEESLSDHAVTIYKKPAWPARPLFYVCCPSKSDPSVAPAGHENIFLLMPLAPGLEDEEPLREKYFHLMMDRLEAHTGNRLRAQIRFRKSYCVSDFRADYNAFKGNAYGLANTLRQTAVLKPAVRNRRLHNLVYAGQLTVPGPGVPPALISGKIAADELRRTLEKEGMR